MDSIELIDVSKQYTNGVIGLKSCSLKIPRGKVTLLIGENGAGKSTFINMLGGYIFPTLGKILYNSECLGKGLFKKIGFCTQDLSIDWYLDVYNNILMGALLADMPLKVSRDMTDKIIDLVGLSDYKNQGVEALSGGQQQRVQVARALVHNPEVIILDEPIVGLDLDSSIKLLTYLRNEAHQFGKTVIISSHQFSLLEKFSDDILLLSKGEVIQHKKIDDFKDPFKCYQKYVISFEEQLNNIMIDELNKVGYVYCSEKSIEIISDIDMKSLVNLLNEYVEFKEIKINELLLQDIMLFLNNRGGVGSLN